MTPRFLLVALLLASPLACSRGGQVDTDVEREAILAADRAWSETADDADAFAAAFTEDGVLIPPGDVSAWGSEAIRTAHSELLDSGGSVEWSASSASVSECGDLGYSIGDFEVSTGAGGATLGEYVTIWRKQPDGEWKVEVDVASSSGPGEGAMVELDPVELDPDHYSVEFENERVRVLRISYPPGEHSIMHQHPDAVAVFLTDGRTKFTLPDGEREQANEKGQAIWTDAEEHLPENVGDSTFELILVELKG